MTIAKKVEEFKEKLEKHEHDGGFIYCKEDFCEDVEDFDTDLMIEWLETSLREVEEAEHKRCVDLLDNDHTKCVVKESCIGYQNAQSDLINNPPKP